MRTDRSGSRARWAGWLVGRVSPVSPVTRYQQPRLQLCFLRARWFPRRGELVCPVSLSGRHRDERGDCRLSITAARSAEYNTRARHRLLHRSIRDHAETLPSGSAHSASWRWRALARWNQTVARGTRQPRQVQRRVRRRICPVSVQLAARASASARRRRRCTSPVTTRT